MESDSSIQSIPKERKMLDLVFLAVGVGAFGLFAVYARLLERL
jgi:hypothetical protein